MRNQKKRKESLLRRIAKRIFSRELVKNKIYALGLMLLGYITVPLSGGNGDAFIFTLFIGLIMFFADENVIN